MEPQSVPPFAQHREPVVEAASTEDGKVRRISNHTRGLIDDLRGWVDLKLKLTKLEVQEQIDEKMNQAIWGGAVALMGLLALVFLLATLALFLGDWLGHPKWGFLIVTVVLGVAAYVLVKLKPRLMARGTRKVVVPAKRLKAPVDNDR